MPDLITVAVVDDHPLVCRGIAATFERDGRFRVVATGRCADDAVGIARTEHPDIVTLDVNMPGKGIAAASAIAAEHHQSVAVLMVSMCDDLPTVRAALQAGARGYVSKGASARELVQAALDVQQGRFYISPDLGARLLERLR